MSRHGGNILWQLILFWVLLTAFAFVVVGIIGGVAWLITVIFSAIFNAGPIAMMLTAGLISAVTGGMSIVTVARFG